MKSLYWLIKKDVKLFMSDRVAVAMTFIVPLVLIVIFGLVFGGLGGDSSPIKMIGINHNNAAITKRLMLSLDSSKSLQVLHTYKQDSPPHAQISFDDSTAAQWVRTGKVSAALIIPVDAITDTSTGLKLQFLYDPRNEIESQMLEGILQQTIMTKTPGLFTSLMQRSATRFLGSDSGNAFNNKIAETVSEYFGIPKSDFNIPNAMNDTTLNNESDSSQSRSGNFFSNLIQFDRKQLVGVEITNPMVTRSMGGWAIMFVLFSLTASARSIIQEREKGTLHRLLSAPISGGQILWGKYIYAWLLGIVQIFALFFFGSLIFSVDIYSNMFNLCIIIFLSAGAATSFGMFLASIVKTSEQANGLSTILILSMSAIGGSWFPVSLMPEFIQHISRFTLTYWSIEGFLTVLWRGLGVGYLLPNIAVLTGIIIVLMTISVWLFKRKSTV